jgi:hypothetical protein
MSHRVVAVRGTADNPMDQVEVEAKARDLMADILGGRQCETLIKSIRGLAQAKDVARLRRLWQAPTPRASGGTRH